MVTKAAIPDTQDALEEFLSDPDDPQVKEAFADSESSAKFIQAYADAFAKRDKSETWEQLTEQQQSVLEKFMTERGYVKADPKRVPLTDDISTPGGVYKGLDLDPKQKRQIAATGRGPGMELAGKFNSPAEFFKAAWHRSGGRDERLKNLNESQGDQGGFLVPEEFRAELLRLALEQAVVRPRARVIPMNRQTIGMPAIRDTSHASTVYGGVSASWVAEGADLSSATNEPTFASVRLDAKKLSGYTVAGNELLADSAIALESILMELFGDAIAYFEDDAFIAGIGAAQPVGVLNADALISVSAETGQAATTIVYENVIKMFSRMLPASIGSAVWYAHIDTFPALATMSLDVGTGGAPVWNANAVGAPTMTLLGRPVIFTEKAETLGTSGDLVFADFRQYLIGDRQTLSVDSSPHVRFTTDETVWRFIQRVDGRPWIDSALTPRNGTNTLSPFVALATRS